MTELKGILRLAKQGFKVFPVRADKKIPHIKGWYENATADTTQIRKWWKKWPGAGVGLPTGAINGLWVVDVDVKNGKDGEETLRNLPELLCNLEQTTRSGGRHLFFKHHSHYELKSRVNVLGEGVDVRCDGGYVLVAPTEGYGVSLGGFDVDLRDAPSWCIDMASVKINKVGTNGAEVKLTEKEIRMHLANCPIECYGTRDSWLSMIMAVKSASGGDEYGLQALLDWTEPEWHNQHDDAEKACITAWNSVSVSRVDGPNVKAGSLISASNAHKAIAKSKTAFDGFVDVTEEEAGNCDAWQFNEGKLGAMNSSDRNIYCLIEQPKFKPTAHSPSETNPFYRSIGFDELKGQTVFTKPPVWMAPDKAKELVGETLTDNLMHNFMIAAQYMTNVNFPFSRFYAGITGVSRYNSFHPVQDYLNGLEWDGIPRVDNWMQTYLGVPKEQEDTNYLRAISRGTLLGAVNRAFNPGCVMQTMLILESERQGVGKSEAVKILGGDWFFEPHFDIGSKDAEQNLQGTWINEWAELSSMSKKDTDELKDFLSRPKAHLRKSHDRAPTTLFRGCIIIGTTNKEKGAGYFKDPTGARRFLPMQIDGKVDVTHNGISRRMIDRDSLIRDRDQIWAEAVHRFKKGDNVYLEVDEVVEAEVHQKARSVTDGREDPLIDWLYSGEACTEDVITSIEVATRCFQVRPDDAKGYKLREYHRMMLGIGWEYGLHSKDTRKLRGFKRPDNWNPYEELEDDDVTLD